MSDSRRKKNDVPQVDAGELLDLADETRRLISRMRVDDDDAWRETVNKALLLTLKGQQAMLEALASLATRPAAPAAPAPAPSAPPAAVPTGPATAPPAVGGAEPAPASATPGTPEGDAARSGTTSSATPRGDSSDLVTGPRARRVVCEFDQRDKDFDRGLAKLNSWLSGGKAGLPFQKREDHAYLNTGANSDAMIARIETELMNREGFSRKLGRLVIDGLDGEVVIYARIGGPNT